MDETDTIKLKSKLIALFIISACTAASCYMLIQMQDVMNLFLFWIILAAAVLFGAALVVSQFLGYERIVKLGIIIIMVLVFIIGVFFIIYQAGYIELLDDIDALRDEIAKTESASFAYIFVQFAQVCFLPIPGTVTTLLGLLLFNPIDAICYSLIGMILGAIVMFFFGKYAGRKAVDWALGKDDVQKYLDMVNGKDNAILTAMFLLPIFPDDLLCAVAGITGMNTWYFIIVLSVSRILSTVISVLFFTGNFIPLYGWWLVLWGVIIASIVAIAVVFFKNIDAVENKITAIVDKFNHI